MGERDAANAFEAFLDELVAGQDGRTIVDPELAQIARRYHALGQSLAPSGACERVWQRLQERETGHATDARALPAITHLPPGSPLHPNGRAVIRSSRDRGSLWRRGMIGQLAAAAVLVLALVSSLVVTGLLRPGREVTQPIGIPAVLPAPATPTPGAESEETLLEIPLPGELVPQGDRVTAVLDHLTSPPGSSGRWQGIDDANWPGLRVHYVLDGSLTVRAEGPVQVVRAGAGAMLEDVHAGKEFVLGPGDTWIAHNEVPFEAVNTSQAPTDLLRWVLANIEDPEAFGYYPVPSSWETHNYVGFPPGVEVPEGPATLRIRRVELPAKGRLPAPLHGLQYGLTLPTDASGTPVVGPSVGNLPDGRLVNLGRNPTTVYVLSLESDEAT